MITTKYKLSYYNCIFIEPTNKQYVLTDDEDELNNATSSDTDWQDEDGKENRSKSAIGSKVAGGELTYLDLTHDEVIVDEDHKAPDASGNIRLFWLYLAVALQIQTQIIRS